MPDGLPADKVWAVDDCKKVEVDVVLSEEIIPGDCPGNYRVIRTWTAVDDCGNVATAQQVVYVEDLEAPKFQCAVEDIKVPCGTIPEPTHCTAYDNCDPSVDVTFDVVKSEADADGNWTLTYTWTATDDCGNTSTLVQTIHEICKKKEDTRVSASPNPFRSQSVIRFTPAESGPVSLSVYDLQGRLVSQLFSGEGEAGVEREVIFEAGDRSESAYMVRLTSSTDVTMLRLFRNQ